MKTRLAIDPIGILDKTQGTRSTELSSDFIAVAQGVISTG